MRILIACEESDEVRSRFEKIGFDAYSCDIQPNRNPNAKHFQCDIFDILNNEWLAMIAFPPCTHLAVSGAAWFEKKRNDGRQQQGIDFFMSIINAPIKHIAVENPIGIMSKIYKKPDQIIHPYYFGDDTSKATCLWLKNLPKLYHNKEKNLFDDHVTHVKPYFTKFIGKNGKISNHSRTSNIWYKSNEIRSKERSKTFPGIAHAMATQWGEYLKNIYLK